MPTTPNRNYPYPSLASANDPPRDIQLLAEALDNDIGALMSAAPIAPVYEDGWADYGGGTTFLGVAATRSASGLVGLSGMFGRTGSNIAATLAAQDILELPEGYRPARQIIILCNGYSSGTTYPLCRVDIHPDGLLQARWAAAAFVWNGSSPSSWVTLSGVSYVAAS